MIKSVHIQNFKSLRDLHLDLERRNVLVGPNMSGKSNILDVFRFLSHMVIPQPGAFGVLNALTLRNGFSEVAWKGAVNTSAITIAVEGDMPNVQMPGELWKWNYKISILGNVRGVVHIQEESLALEGKQGRAELIEKDQGRRILRSADGRVLSHIVDDRSALEFEIPDWEGTLVREYFMLFRFYRVIPQLMKQANPASAARFLNEFGENLGAWLMTLQTRYPDAFARIRSVAKDVFPQIAELFTSPTAQASVFLASQEKHLKLPVNVWLMSDGELSFLALLSLLYAPDELGGSLYCVEEPENHLHPKLLETLLELHNQVLQEKKENAGQVLLTTHSPQLVDLCELDDLIVVERRVGETQCTRPKNKSHLKELLSGGEISLGSLFFSGALSGAE